MYKKSRHFSFRHRGFECVDCHKEDMIFGMGDDPTACGYCGGALKKKWDNLVFTAQEVSQYVVPVAEAPVNVPVEAAPAAPAETAQSEAEHPMVTPTETPAEAPTEPTPAA